MDVKVLGTGCAKCNQLYAEAQKAIADAGVQATLTKVEDVQEILAHGVMATPALVVDGQVKASGRVPGAAEIAGWLSPSKELPVVVTDPCCGPAEASAACCCGGGAQAAEKPCPFKKALPWILILAAVAIGLYAALSPSSPVPVPAAPAPTTQPAQAR